MTFYARQRIQPQMDMVEKGSGDREARELWSALQVRGGLRQGLGAGLHRRRPGPAVGARAPCRKASLSLPHVSLTLLRVPVLPAAEDP